MNQHENNSQSQTFNIYRGLGTTLNVSIAIHNETQEYTTNNSGSLA